MVACTTTKLEVDRLCIILPWSQSHSDRQCKPMIYTSLNLLRLEGQFLKITFLKSWKEMVRSDLGLLWNGNLLLFPIPRASACVGKHRAEVPKPCSTCRLSWDFQHNIAQTFLGKKIPLQFYSLAL